MGKTLKEKELEKKEQELIILTIFAIGLLESTKPNRNAKDYIRAGLLGFGFLYSVALILYSILSSFSRQLPNSTPGHLNKDELKKLYENVPLVKPKPLIRQPLACFDPNKPGSEVDWARMKMKVPYEGLVQIDQVYTDAYATCKSNDLYQPLNCERVIEDNICQKIQQ